MGYIPQAHAEHGSKSSPHTTSAFTGVRTEEVGSIVLYQEGWI